MTCTGSIASTAATVAAVIEETRNSDVSERGASRADDKTSEAAMEDRKRNGYF
jgi:sulfate adenylyltransferase subunit 2